MSKPAAAPGIDAELAGRAERAVVRRGLDSDLVERGVEVEQRGRRVGDRGRCWCRPRRRRRLPGGRPAA